MSTVSIESRGKLDFFWECLACGHLRPMSVWDDASETRDPETERLPTDSGEQNTFSPINKGIRLDVIPFQINAEFAPKSRSREPNISKSSVLMDADVFGCINIQRQMTFNASHPAPEASCRSRDFHVHISEILVSNDPGPDLGSRSPRIRVEFVGPISGLQRTDRGVCLGRGRGLGRLGHRHQLLRC